MFDVVFFNATLKKTPQRVRPWKNLEGALKHDELVYYPFNFSDNHHTHTLFHCWAFHKGRLSCHLQADNDPLGCAASESHISRSGCAHGNSTVNNDFQWWLFHEWFPWSSNHVQFFTRVRMVRMYNQTPGISMIVCFSRCSWVPWMKKGCKSW